MRIRRDFATAVRVLALMAAAVSSACGAGSVAVEDPSARLASAAPWRCLEPRLSLDQRWRRCDAPVATGRLVAAADCGSLGPPTPDARRELARAVSAVRAAGVAEGAGARQLHAVALAHLVAEGGSAEAAERAVARLEEASRSMATDADLASDLAAAYLVRAHRRDDPEDLVRALDAAETALDRSPDHHAALYNRALALSHLALRRQAIDAWKKYLSVDGRSAWADEVRQRLERLTAPTLSQAWPDREAELRRGLAAGSASGLDALVERYPQQVRLFVEDEALGAWGEALERGDAAAAAARLAALESVSRELAARQEDDLLAHAVARLRGEAASDLARAHRLYRDGRRLYARFLYRQADERFARSAYLLERHRSPFAFWPLFYRAAIVHHRPEFDRSAKLFRQLDLDPRFDRPLAHAYCAWMLGLTRLRTGRFAPSEDDFLRAREIFARAGETENRAAMDVQLAWVAEETGEPGESWRYRYRALLDLDRTITPRRVLNTLSTTARQLSTEGRHRAALYFHSAHVEAAEATGDGVSTALARAERADALLRLDRAAAAAADLDRAERLVATVPDAGVRDDAEAEIALVRARHRIVEDPALALPLLDQVGGFARRHGEDRMLIEQHRLRARAFRALDDPAAAERELYAALEQVERQRARLEDPHQRRAYLDQARSVAEDLVAHLFDAGKTEAAFEACERARAPVLREELAGEGRPGATRSIAEMRSLLPPHAAILSYLVLEERVLGWMLRRQGLTPFVLEIGARDLSLTTEAWVEALRSGAGGGTGALAVGWLPAAPLPWRGVEELVVVPDGPLHAVPFRALPDPEGSGLVVENRAVGRMPGANLYFDLLDREAERPPRRPESLLVVTDVPRSPLFPGLPEVRVRDDLARLRQLFPVVEVLRGPDATEQRLLDLLPAFEVVEFGGHAVVSDGGGPGAEVGLVLAAGRDGAGDGWLTPDEIRLPDASRTRLVVLAGCRTAAGRASASEGVLGLARPLLAAGVRTVVANLWPLTDAEAAQVLSSMSRSLAGAEAAPLRRAQVEQLRRPNGSGSHAWAGFVAWGHPI